MTMEPGANLPMRKIPVSLSPCLLVSLSPCLFLFLLLAGCSRPLPPSPSVEPESVEFPTREGKGQGVLFHPPIRGEHPAIVLIHGDFGLNDPMRQNADKVAQMGYLVLAVDLFRGEKPDNVLDAHIIDRGMPEERVKSDLAGAVDFLVKRDEVTRGVLGAIGWDMGGGYALDAAISDPRITAVVTCYGRLTTDPQLLGRMNASVLGIFAGKDEGIGPETIESFRKAMAEAGKKVAGLHTFDDRDNGFMNQTPSGNAPAAKGGTRDAWVLIDRFFAAELR